MSEVVKKLVTELGYKIVDQDKIKKYSNTAKDILKTQKETNKATEKGAKLQKEKHSELKKENQERKNELKKELKNREKEIEKALETERKNREKSITNETKQRKKEKEKLNKQYDKEYRATEKKQETQREKDKLAINKQFNDRKLKDEQIIIKAKTSMYERMFDEIANKEKTKIQKTNEYKQKQEEKNQRGQERRDIIASNRAGAYDRKLNFGANQRGQTFDTRMNDILARKGKMIDPNNPNRIINIPKQSSFTYPTQQEKQGAREDLLQGGGAAVGVGSIALISKFIKESANLENELVRIKTFGDVTSAEGMNRIREAIKLATEVSVFSPTDIAKQGVEFGKAGLKETGAKKDLSSMMLANTKFARISDASTEESAKVLLSIMKTFGIPAERAGETMDKIAYALNETLLDFDKLQYSVAYSASSFNNVGMSVEDLLGASGFLANRGVPASTMGTSLRSIITSVSLLKSSFYKKISDKKDKAKIATKIKDLGIDEKQFMKGNALDALTLIGSSKKFKGMSKAEQQAIYFDLFGKPAMGAAMMLGSMKPEERKFFQNVKDPNVTRGYTDRTLSGLNVGTKYQMGQTQSKGTLAMASLGNQFNPDIATGTSILNSISEAITKSEQLQKNLAGLARLGTVGGTLIGIAGGVRLLGLALGLPVFAIGAPWILGITAISLGLNDIWNALNGRESYLLNVGNWFHKLGGSILNFLDTSIIPAIKYMDSLFQSVRNFLGLESNKTFNVDVVVKGGQQFGFSGGLPSSPKPTGAINWNKSMANRAG